MYSKGIIQDLTQLLFNSSDLLIDRDNGNFYYMGTYESVYLFF